MISVQTDRLLESAEIGPFLYRRRSFHSQALNKEMAYGVLSLRDRAADPDPHRATIYVLHGANGDDSQTIQAGLPQTLTPEILDKLSAINAQFVLPAIDASFLAGAYLEYFMGEILPGAEKGTLTEDSKRYLVGYSAGGQAALSAFLGHSARFRGVGAHFPVFPTFEYMRPASAVEYIARTGADRAFVDVAVQCFKSAFGSEEAFQRHNPLRLAEGLTREQFFGKRVYFDVGSKDEFGLYEGCEAFHQTLFQKDVPHSFEIVADGRHDASFLQARFPVLMHYILK